jgi:hypothetical protein
LLTGVPQLGQYIGFCSSFISCLGMVKFFTCPVLVENFAINLPDAFKSKIMACKSLIEIPVVLLISSTVA